jgi:hypothetical protein
MSKRTIPLTQATPLARQACDEVEQVAAMAAQLVEPDAQQTIPIEPIEQEEDRRPHYCPLCNKLQDMNDQIALARHREEVYRTRVGLPSATAAHYRLPIRYLLPWELCKAIKAAEDAQRLLEATRQAAEAAGRLFRRR